MDKLYTQRSIIIQNTSCMLKYISTYIQAYIKCRIMIMAGGCGIFSQQINTHAYTCLKTEKVNTILRNNIQYTLISLFDMSKTSINILLHKTLDRFWAKRTSTGIDDGHVMGRW